MVCNFLFFSFFPFFFFCFWYLFILSLQILVTGLRRSYFEACGVLVTKPAIKPCTASTARQILNHWTTRSVPPCISLWSYHLCIHFLSSILFLPPFKMLRSWLDFQPPTLCSWSKLLSVAVNSLSFLADSISLAHESSVLLMDADCLLCGCWVPVILLGTFLYTQTRASMCMGKALL